MLLVESEMLGFGIQNSDQVIARESQKRLEMESKFHVKESGVQCLESVGTAQNPESKH